MLIIPSVHYLAYRIGNILHRDVSEYNVMAGRDANGSVIGILNDWDMAKLLSEEQDGLTAAKHRTGSPPFTALELLSGKGSPHYFRHDLESFFWLLVWAVLHYNLTAMTRDVEVNTLAKGMVGDADENRMWKSNALSTWSDFKNELVEMAKPEFEELCSPTGWVIQLLHFFTKAKGAYAAEDHDSTRDTLRGRITFKTFMAAIGVTPREWGIEGFLDE